MITGVAAMPMHLKGLLDKLGIKADFLHVGDYKGAAEPLTLDKPSDAMNETLGAILDQSYASLVDGIAQGRGLTPEIVRAHVDTAMFNTEEAMSAKLIDHVATYEAYRSERAGELPWKQVGLEEKKEAGLSEIMEMVGIQPRERSRDDHVAVVYAVGNIIDGAGEGMLGAREEIASHTLIAALAALTAADSVKAVVLRIDSGGGSALASELIWHAVEKLKLKKPVVVSMGGVAASGGYYISAGANRIFADETTLTGSIGVVGGKLAIGGALEKIGVKSFPIGRGKRSMMWSSMGAWSTDERAIVQKMMEDIYKIFVQRVADGRGKTYDEIHALAQGRVWTGKAALANGLVDEIGGLDAAVAHASKLAGMQEPGELELYPPQPRLTDYLSSYASGVMLSTPELLSEVEALLGAEAAGVVAKTLRQVASFRQSAVQTTLILPVLWK
jgi:protease-4